MKKTTGKLPNNTTNTIGIDPGVNFGLTIIHGEDVSMYWGKLPSENRPGLRGVYTYDFLSEFLSSNVDLLLDGSMRGYVEGAAYNSKFGQVGLEEVRFGFYLCLYHLEYKVEIVPPATVRKTVFGSGKLHASDVWPTLNHNAADSLGLALYGLKET